MVLAPKLAISGTIPKFFNLRPNDRREAFGFAHQKTDPDHISRNERSCPPSAPGEEEHSARPNECRAVLLLEADAE
jgi:hypothetical protein